MAAVAAAQKSENVPLTIISGVVCYGCMGENVPLTITSSEVCYGWTAEKRPLTITFGGVCYGWTGGPARPESRKSIREMAKPSDFRILFDHSAASPRSGPIRARGRQENGPLTIAFGGDCYGCMAGNRHLTIAP